MEQRGLTAGRVEPLQGAVRGGLVARANGKIGKPVPARLTGEKEEFATVTWAIASTETLEIPCGWVVNLRRAARRRFWRG
jgi:hypothetical protein